MTPEVKTSKTKTRKPTLKQKTALQKVLENGGNVSKAMREAGYSEASVNNPQSLTQSDGWISLAEQYLPDEKLILKTLEGLDAQKVISATITNGHSKDADSQTNDFIEVPDFAVRHKYLQTALEIRKKLTKEAFGISVKDGDKEVKFVVTRGNGS